VAEGIEKVFLIVKWMLSERLTGNPSRLTVMTALSGAEMLPIVLRKANRMMGDQMSRIMIRMSGIPIKY
jgi:hypothetical protein